MRLADRISLGISLLKFIDVIGNSFKSSGFMSRRPPPKRDDPNSEPFQGRISMPSVFHIRLVVKHSPPTLASRNSIYNWFVSRFGPQKGLTMATCTAPGHPTCTITYPNGCGPVYAQPNGPCSTFCSDSKEALKIPEGR